MTREMVIESGHRIRLFSFTVLTTMQKKNTRRSSGDGARAGSDRELRELLDLQFKGRLAATSALQVRLLISLKWVSVNSRDRGSNMSSTSSG